MGLVDRADEAFNMLKWREYVEKGIEKKPVYVLPNCAICAWHKDGISSFVTIEVSDKCKAMGGHLCQKVWNSKNCKLLYAVKLVELEKPAVITPAKKHWWQR